MVNLGSKNKEFIMAKNKNHRAVERQNKELDKQFGHIASGMKSDAKASKGKRPKRTGRVRTHFA